MTVLRPPSCKKDLKIIKLQHSLTQIIAVGHILLRAAQPEGALSLRRLPLQLRHVQVGPITERHVRTRPEITQVCKVRLRYEFLSLFYSFYFFVVGGKLKKAYSLICSAGGSVELVCVDAICLWRDR